MRYETKGLFVFIGPMFRKRHWKLIMRIREISRAGTRNKMDDKLMKLKKAFSIEETSLTSRAEHFVVKCQWYTENSTNIISETNKFAWIFGEIRTYMRDFSFAMS